VGRKRKRRQYLCGVSGSANGYGCGNCDDESDYQEKGPGYVGCRVEGEAQCRILARAPPSRKKIKMMMMIERSQAAL